MYEINRREQENCGRECKRFGFEIQRQQQLIQTLTALLFFSLFFLFFFLGQQLANQLAAAMKAGVNLNLTGGSSSKKTVSKSSKSEADSPSKPTSILDLASSSK